LGNRVVDPETNDQFAVYSVAGATGRSKAFKVGLSVGKTPPGRKRYIYITAVSEYSVDEMYRERTGHKPITLPQQ
jgi:hypothetical protein